MRLEILRGLGEPIVIEGVSRVLVAGDDGTPVSCSSEWSAGNAPFITTTHAGEPEFAGVLAALGVDRTVLVNVVRTPPA